MLTFCKWQRVYLQTALLMVSRQKLLLYDVHRTKKWIASSLLYASCSKQFIHVNTALGILQGKGLIYNTLMRSLITRHQRHGVPQLEPTGNVHSRPKRCGKWLSEPLNFLVANYKKSISACFKRGNVAWIGHSMNGLKTRQIHIHHYHCIDVFEDDIGLKIPGRPWCRMPRDSPRRCTQYAFLLLGTLQWQVQVTFFGA